MKESPRIIRKNNVFKTPWFNINKKKVLFDSIDPSEHYYSLQQPDYVSILARTKNGEIILVRQYRPAVDSFVFEFPGGHIDAGESPQVAAMRELKEETNYMVSNLIFLGKLVPDSGRLENKMWAFYASNAKFDRSTKPKDYKTIKTYSVKPDKFLEMIDNGKFQHALDLGVVTLACLKNLLRLNRKREI